jgi:sulfate adenylyltransferase
VATLSLSGTELRSLLARGGSIPEWFTFPEVAAHLRVRYPPRTRQGVTIFFTGLSGAGKSTIASVLLVKLQARGVRAVTMLDGDAVRKNLSSELGFSRSDRDTNIRRIGFVASEVTRHGGIAICAAIAPYDATRKEVRAAISHHGGFVLVHVATPLEVCERRDRKGLYAKARAGLIPQFTGISDPYEPPDDAEITVGRQDTPAHAAEQILTHLEEQGFLTMS